MPLTPFHAQLLFVRRVTDLNFVVHVIPVKEHAQHTIGVEFSSRTVKLGEKRIKLQVRPLS